MFHRSASLVIPHLKSFAAIPSVSLVQLRHTNRSVFLSHESQRAIALVEALSRPIPCYQQGEVGEEKRACASQCLCFGRSRGPLAQEWFRQTKPKKVRFMNFWGRSPELVPETLFACKCWTKALKE